MTVLAAGAPGIACSGPDRCIRIMTGAVRPEGTDAIVPIERVQIDGNMAVVDDAAVVEPGRFIHPRGSDRRQGDTVLEPGIKIGPAETAVLASAGRADVRVASLPRVAVISTGDELVPVEAAEIAPFQIRSSNDLAIASSLARSGVAVTHRALLPDDPDTILARVTELHEQYDMLILSGGVSMGEFDFVPAVLDALGSEPIFHRIAQKPGRPMWFGMSAAAKPIFALPGNPVSTLLCMTRYVLPALRRSLGQCEPSPEYARLAEAITGPGELTWFVPVVIRWSQTGEAFAEPHLTNTSGDFATLAATDGFLELDGGVEHRDPVFKGR